MKIGTKKGNVMDPRRNKAAMFEVFVGRRAFFVKSGINRGIRVHVGQRQKDPFGTAKFFEIVVNKGNTGRISNF